MNDDKTRIKPSGTLDSDQPTVLSSGTMGSGSDAATVFAGDDGKTRVKLSAPGSDSAESERILGVGDTVKQRFVLDKLLGVGGMGAVFRALDLRKKEAGDDRPYIAIKVLGEEFKDHPQALITLQREAKKTQDLAHPNIVTVYDFDRDGSLVYLTMEELKGHPLTDIMSGAKGAAPLDIKQKLTIIREIAQGLAYAHSKGIVHSDLKPANIFITESGHVKILDFGIARAANEELYQDSFDAGELGAVTFAYASPEMLRFDPPHPSDDIYALGIIACELLGNKHPFDNLDAESAQKQQLAPQLPKQRNPLMTKLLARSLTFDRRHRVQDAAAFLKQLNLAQSGPRRLTIAATVLLFAALGNYLYIQTIEVSDAQPFSALPQEQQQAFQDLLTESNTALRFGDLQGAVINIDKAYQIHATNEDIKKAVAQVVKIIQDNMASAPDPSARQFYQQQITQLRQYSAFSDAFTEASFD